MTQIIPNNDSKFDGKDKLVSIFFVFFAIIIIISQILQFTNAKKTNEKYAAIISSKNKAIHATHTILISSSTIQRSLFNLTLSPDSTSGEVAKVKERLSLAIKNNEDNLVNLKSSFGSDNKEEQELLKKIDAANESYGKAYRTYLQLLASNEKSNEELQKFRLTILRPALDLYQSLQQELLTMLTNDFEKQSQLLSESGNRTGWTLLILGMSPYIFIFLSLIYFILKLIGVSFLSREKV